jgi:hypothetical protein
MHAPRNIHYHPHATTRCPPTRRSYMHANNLNQMGTLQGKGILRARITRLRRCPHSQPARKLGSRLEFRLGLFDDSDVRPKLRMRLEPRLGLFDKSDILRGEITAPRAIHTRAKPPCYICLYDTHDAMYSPSTKESSFSSAACRRTQEQRPKRVNAHVNAAPDV